MSGRGAFVKRFNTLSEVVKYMTSSKQSILFASHEEWEKLTPSERHILRTKFQAVVKKHDTQEAKKVLNKVQEKLNELGISPSA